MADRYIPPLLHDPMEGRIPEEATDDDFITVQHIPNSHPSRYVVEIRRYKILDKAHVVSQSSEPMGRFEAKALAMKWAHWHRLEVR